MDIAPPPRIARPSRRLPAVRWATTPPAPAPTMKGVLDATLAAILLIPAAPVVAAAMLLVRATSRGPAVYTQTRLGRFGRPFTIYKLRTMCADAESLTGARWSLPGDPRITPLGKVLRALHIDELPQLWNILRGDMSLVGPRPERPEIAVTLRKHIPGYDRRLAVKPGLTGLAQIHLPPDETITSVKRKQKYDLAYVRNVGVLTDLRILGCTALKVFGLRRLYCRK
jgi:lipopolysaccharide/colanic/teichoic acid biosynthesis glycosyltransferase